MKKLVFGALSVVFLSATLISCGGGGLSEEDIAKKAKEKYDENQAELLEKANEECEKVVEGKLDSIRTAMAEKEEEETEE